MKAIVLCAGHGTRLGELTRSTPKPMLPVAGRPIVEHLIRHLAAHGVTEVAVNLHYRGEQIRQHLGDGSWLGVRLVYSPEPELLGTAGGTREMAELLAPFDHVLVQYGDVLTDQDLTELVRTHLHGNALATILVHQRPGSNSVVVLDDEHRVTRFLERPDPEQRRGIDSPWVHSGLAVLSAEMIRTIPRGRPSDLPRDHYTRMAGTGRLFACPLSGARFAIDSPERLVEADRAVRDGRCHPGGG